MEETHNLLCTTRVICHFDYRHKHRTMISEMSRNSSFIETALDRNTNINMITAMDLTAAKAIGGGGGG